MGRVARARLVAARPPGAPRRAVRRTRSQRGVPRLPRVLGAATPPRRASPGSTPTTPTATSSPSYAGAPDAPDVVCVSNFASIPHEHYRLGLPAEGEWREILNTDAEIYGGSGVGNLGAVTATADPSLADTPGASAAYAEIVVPPLATVWFRRDG